MKTPTLDAGGKATEQTNRTTQTDSGNGRIKNLPSVAVSIGAVKPTGRLIEAGNPAPIQCPAGERDAKRNGKAKGKTKGKAAAPFVRVETPPEAKKLAAEFRPDFTADCAAWLVMGKSGQMRVCDVPVIAAHLLSKKQRYVFNEIPESVIGTDKEKELRKQCRKTMQTMRKSFSKLLPSEKAAWLGKAKPVFNRSLREFLKKTAPIKKAIHLNSRFKLKTAQVFCSKKGIVSLGTVAKCNDFVAEPSK